MAVNDERGLPKFSTYSAPPAPTASGSCPCCDGKGYQTRQDGIRVPCPGCRGVWYQPSSGPIYPVWVPMWPPNVTRQ